MQPSSQDPINTTGQPSPSFSSDPPSQFLPDTVYPTSNPYERSSYTQPSSPPPPSENYPPYGDGGPATQQAARRDEKPRTSPQPPKRNGWKMVSLFLFILVLILGATTTASLLTHPASPQIAQATPAPTISQKTVLSPTTGIATNTAIPSSTPTFSVTPTAQTGVLVASGTITENLQLTCGANCDDPIHVTITSIHVDDGSGNMTWNISLKNVSGNSMGYGINTFELLASGAQNQIHATFAQSSGTLANSDPVSVQGTFSFVPIQNTSYTLTVVVAENPFMGPLINFDPAQITNL